MFLGTLKRAIGVAVCALAMLATLGLQEVAWAGGWSALSRTSLMQGVQTGWLPAKRAADYQLLQQNIAYLDSDAGLAMLRIPASQIQGRTRIMVGGIPFSLQNTSAPVVFAKYDPNTATGVISVLRIERAPNGDFLVVQKRFSPSDGQLWSAKYGMNPFSQFAGGAAGSFIKINPSAFYAVVGLILIQQRAENAWVANLQTTQNVSTSSSGGLFRKTVTTTLTANTKPQWTLITHPDLPVAGAAHTGYKLPNGQSVYSPANIVFQGVGYNLPDFSVTSYTHSQSKTSWTGFAMAIFSAVAFAVASFVAPYLTGSLSASLQGAFQSVGSQLGLSGSYAAAATGASLNLAYNNFVAGVSPFDGANGVFASGQSTLNVNSLSGGGFDWRKPVFQHMIEPSDLSTPGAIGSFFNTTKPGAGSFVHGISLSPDFGTPTNSTWATSISP